jgi:hypothetical protein
MLLALVACTSSPKPEPARRQQQTPTVAAVAADDPAPANPHGTHETDRARAEAMPPTLRDDSPITPVIMEQYLAIMTELMKQPAPLGEENLARDWETTGRLCIERQFPLADLKIVSRRVAAAQRAANHSEDQKSRVPPGDVALLDTYATQLAVLKSQRNDKLGLSEPSVSSTPTQEEQGQRP